MFKLAEIELVPSQGRQKFMFSSADIPVSVAPSTGTCSALFPSKAFLSLEKGERTLNPTNPFSSCSSDYEARSGIRAESVTL